MALYTLQLLNYVSVYQAMINEPIIHEPVNA